MELNNIWKVKVTQSCTTFCSPMDCIGQNTGVGSLSLLQGIFPTQGSNSGLPHCRRILYQLSHKGSPRILEWVAYPFSSGSSRPRNWTGVSCIVGRFFTNWAMREAPYCFSSFGKTEITCFSCIQWQLQFIYYCTLNALILQDTPYTLTHLFSFFLRSNKLSLMYYHFSILINLWDMYLTQIGRTS